MIVGVVVIRHNRLQSKGKETRSRVCECQGVEVEGGKWMTIQEGKSDGGNNAKIGNTEEKVLRNGM